MQDGALGATHRFSIGPGPQYCDRDGIFSKARFRPGEAIAGFAWQDPGKLFVILVPQTVTGRHEYDAWAAEKLAMTSEQLQNLSTFTRLQKFFAAWALTDRNGISLGVICVDSDDPNPFQNEPAGAGQLDDDVHDERAFLDLGNALLPFLEK